MGDLLQTTPLISGLKRKYPAAEITILAQESFRRICAGIPGVDKTLSFDAEEYVARLSDERKSVEENYLKLWRFLKKAGSDYDLVVNLSHSNLSGIMAYIIGGKDCRGIVMTDNGRFVVKHPWMNYFFYVTAHRKYNTFNLVDMYNLTGETDLSDSKLYYKVPEELKSYPDEVLNGRGKEYVGFQLGASTESRRWPPQYFGELAELIRRKYGCEIIAFGSNSERDLLREMREIYQGPLFDMMGKTTIPQLAALLSRCNYLITNDTGTMHLAAAVGTPVIAVFLGEARCSDTGPYTEKALILEANIDCAPCEYNTKCEHYQCRECILPEDILFAMENFNNLTGKTVEQLKDVPRWGKVRLYRPSFEADGLLNVIPLIKRPLTTLDFFKISYRRMRKEILSIPNSYRTGYNTYFLPHEAEQMTAKLTDFLDFLTRLMRLFQKAISLIDDLKQVTSAPLKDKQKILILSKILMMVDDALWQYEWSSEETLPISKSTRLLIRNLESKDSEIVMSTIRNIYAMAETGCKLVIKDVEDYLNTSNK